MQRSPAVRKAEQKTTGRIFVVGIIFDQFGGASRLTYFRVANVPFDRAFESMLRELKVAARQFLSNLLKRFHCVTRLCIVHSASARG